MQGLLDHAESPSEGSGLENCGIDDELVQMVKRIDGYFLE